MAFRPASYDSFSFTSFPATCGGKTQVSNVVKHTTKSPSLQSQGQSKPKNCPSTRTANHPNFPAVSGNNLPAKIQAQTQTDRVSGLITPNVKVKKMFALFRQYSHPVIFNCTVNHATWGMGNGELGIYRYPVLLRFDLC